MGDDINDLAAMELAGLAAAPGGRAPPWFATRLPL